MTTTTTRRTSPGPWAGALLALLLAPGPAAAAENEIGRLTSAGNGFVRRHYEYDAMGRTRREVHVLDRTSFVYTNTFGYPAGSVSGPGIVPLTLTFPDNETVAYGYDADGHLDTVTAGGQPVVKGIARNARGQTMDIAYGNDARTIRRYNEGSDLRLNLIKSCFGPISADACFASGTPFQAYTYTYDPNGNVLSVTDHVVQGTYSSTYGYDSLDQLVSRASAGATSTYGYDDVGNLVSKEGVAQAYGPGVCGDSRRGPHALALSGGDCYSYDANGNVVSTSSGLSLTWNSENMATGVAKGSTGYQKHFLGGSLWKKTEAGLTTQYLPSMRKEGAKARKFYGAFAERSAEDEQLRFYHSDHLGSSTVMTGPGSLLAHRSAFKPYGEDVDAGGGGFIPKLRFNFKEKEPTGLYDYGGRLYNPATGRWLSADPVMADGPNRYAYVGNNPVGFVDPTGHQKEKQVDRHECGKDGVVCDGDQAFLNRGPGGIEIRAKAEGPPLPMWLAFRQAGIPCDGLWNCTVPVEFTPTLTFARDVLGPGNDIIGGWGNMKGGFNDYFKNKEIADGTRISRTGRITLGRPLNSTRRALASAGRFGLYGDALALLDTGAQVAMDVERQDYAAATLSIMEGGINIWGGRVGGAIGLKCGPAAVICSPALGYLGSKSGTALRYALVSNAEYQVRLGADLNSSDPAVAHRARMDVMLYSLR